MYVKMSLAVVHITSNTYCQSVDILFGGMSQILLVWNISYQIYIKI